MLIGIYSFSLHANNSNHYYYNIIVVKLNPNGLNLEPYMNLKHFFHCIGRLIIILLNLIMVLYSSVTEVSLLLWLYICFYIIHKTLITIISSEINIYPHNVNKNLKGILQEFYKNAQTSFISTHIYYINHCQYP